MTPEQLKASILQYAMEGKLVKQDPNDEPASELLGKIEARKAELIKEKKIRKSKKLTAITGDEVPFDIPNNWAWVRLGNIARKLTDGTHNPPPNSHTGKQVISARNIKNGKIDFSLSDRFVTETQFIKEDKRTHIRKGNVLLTIVGSLGNVAVVETDKLFTTQRSVAVIDSDLLSKYLYYSLSSGMFQKQISDNAKGTSQKGIYLKTLSELLLPIPPLEEQKRIVAKIEKLMPLVGEYAESYNRLQKIDNEFEGNLKQSILQYAMEGKLVKQDPSYETASELIKKIENEKAELIKEGKIKKSNKLPVITDDEKLFDIPESWEWARLGSIAQAKIGKTPQRHNPDYWTAGYMPWVSISDLTNGYLVETKEEISKKALKDVFHDNFSTKGTLLMSFKLTIGKVAILQINAVHNEAIASIIPFLDVKHILRNYLFITLPMISQNGDFKNAIKGKTLNKSTLSRLLIPLPPLLEQERIVTKIERLMPLIDELKVNS